MFATSLNFDLAQSVCFIPEMQMGASECNSLCSLLVWEVFGFPTYDSILSGWLQYGPFVYVIWTHLIIAQRESLTSHGESIPKMKRLCARRVIYVRSKWKCRELSILHHISRIIALLWASRPMPRHFDIATLIEFLAKKVFSFRFGIKLFTRSSNQTYSSGFAHFPKYLKGKSLNQLICRM